MDKHQPGNKWQLLRSAVKAEWNRLSDDDLDGINGNLERLVGLIQERYGYVRHEAARRLDDFRRRQAGTHA